MKPSIFQTGALEAAVDRAAASRSPISVTFRGRQGYSKDIGKYTKPDGQIVPKRFWLGHDQLRAIWKAGILKAFYDEMIRNDPAGLWTPEHLRLVELFIDSQDDKTRDLAAQAQEAHTEITNRAPASEMPPLPPAPAPLKETPSRAETPNPTANVPPEKATLYGAIAAFLANLKNKNVSDKHKVRAKQILERNLKHARKDCPLSSVDYLWLDGLADYWKSRPKNLKDGTRITAGGVKALLTYTRLLFVWLDDVGYGGWEMPRRGLKCFRARKSDLMTAAEVREAGVIKQFDVETLTAIYGEANDHERTIILAALFCGFTQQELAVLEKSEFDLPAAKLVHVRHKTKVRGEFWLPPELVALLEHEIKRRKNDKLVFRTEDKNALVTFKDGRQTSDAVRQMWDDLRVKAEKPDTLSFKFLRKFLADYVTRNGGEELGMVALSHAPQSVLGRNYTTAHPFERFYVLQKAMYAELTAAGFFTAKPKPKKKLVREQVPA